MRSVSFALLSFVAALCFTQRSALAQADAFGDCKPAGAGVYSEVADDTVVAACTKLIRSGTLSTQELAEAFDRRGVAYDHLRQYETAIADYNEALRLDPGNGEALNNRGVVYKKQKRYSLAIADFTNAMTKLQQDSLPYANRARTYWEMGNLVQAESDFAQAIWSGPYDIDNFKSRADVLADMGRHADAVAQLGEVVNQLRRQQAAGLRIGKPNRDRYAAALDDRCFERAIVGDLRNALSDCEESLSLRPGDPDTLDSKAFVEYKLGRFQDTIRDESAALRGDRRLAEAYYLRGLAKRKVGPATDAASDLRAAAKLQVDIAKEYLRNGIRADGTLAPVKDVSKFCRNGYKDPIVKC